MTMTVKGLGLDVYDWQTTEIKLTNFKVQVL